MYFCSCEHLHEANGQKNKRTLHSGIQTMRIPHTLLWLSTAQQNLCAPTDYDSGLEQCIPLERLTGMVMAQ